MKKQPTAKGKVVDEPKPKHPDSLLERTGSFFKSHWIGLLLITLVTLVFFAPLITKLGSYSQGGDAMFNAWTLGRNHHCILRQGCPAYENGNIYFPNKDSMLFSETQLSAGALTLPLHFINDNPIFAYNVWTILSYLFTGLFMYMLAKRLSHNHEVISIVAALVFEFAPIKMGAGAPSHLQNLSIFYLPIIILAIIKYLDSHSRKYLVVLLAALTLQFYASWYQMVFVLIAVGVYMLTGLVLKIYSKKDFLILSSVVVISLLITLPLASQYSRFSKQNGATFTTSDQITYSSSIADYFIPYEGSVGGKIYHNILPHARTHPYNPDSYSNHGLTLYLVGIFVTVASIFILTKRRKGLDKYTIFSLKQSISLAAVGVTGFMFSLGPIVKLKNNFAYRSLGPGVLLAIPAPWLIVNKLVPQLSFIRATGRISILFLFALCCLLAFLPLIIEKLKIRPRLRYLILAIVLIGLTVELVPLHQFELSPRVAAYNMSVPEIYRQIAKDPSIDNLIILRTNQEYTNDGYPFVRVEDVLWAGYHNKNIFNGYSGYEPKTYAHQYADFSDFKADDIQKMKAIGLKYILLDRSLTPKSSKLSQNIIILGKPILSDNRYFLYKL